MANLTLGEFELAILLSIAALDDAYGAAIRREASERLARDIAVGAVYTTLQRLEEKRLVKSWMSDPTPVRGGRARRCYQLTALGQRSVRAARATRERLWTGVDGSWSPA